MCFVSIPQTEKEDVHVTAIIHWEAAAFFPEWWASLKPRISPGFTLEFGEKEEDWEWNWRPSDAIIDTGIGHPLRWYIRFRDYRLEKETQKSEEHQQNKEG